MKKDRVLTALYACLFSACVTVGGRITFGGDVKLKITQNYIEALRPVDLLVFLAAAAAAAAALLLVQRIRDGCALDKKETGYAKPAAFFALCLAAAWLPYILSVAPGNVYVDSMDSISQMLEHGHPTNNHHPMFYTLMLGVFMKIGTVVFGSVNIGILLGSLFQAAVLLSCIVLVLLAMARSGVPRLMTGISLAYYMFMPYFPNYAMSLWKDVLFSCALLLLSLLLYAFSCGERRGVIWYVCYGAAGVGCMCFRNNGVYVFAAASVLAAWLMRRHARRLLIAAAAALATFTLISGAATRLWNIHSDYVENLGIPLQQLGYTLQHDNDFSGEDREYLYTLMPEDVWAYAYRPCLVDTIKWNPYFDTEFLMETKGEFFGVWLRGLTRNPLDYIRGYLLATHGFWKPFAQNLYGYMDVQMNENPYGIGFMDLFEKLFGFSILPVLQNYPVIMGSGTLLWLCLLGCTIACMRKWAYSAAYLPALLNWATVMIATPVAYSLRYVYVFALGLPLYLMLPMMLRGAQEKREG